MAFSHISNFLSHIASVIITYCIINLTSPKSYFIQLQFKLFIYNYDLLCHKYDFFSIILIVSRKNHDLVCQYIYDIFMTFYVNVMT